MTYQDSIFISYTSKWESLSRNSGYDSDMFLPEEKMEFTVPGASDLNTKQLFQFFKKVMLAMGYAEKSIAIGAMSVVFNGDGDEAMQRAMCDEFDLTLNEDLQDKFEDFKKTEAEWDRIKAKVEWDRIKTEAEWDHIDKLVVEHHGAGPEDYNKTQHNEESSNG